jgi:hypothetical protein
MPAAAADKVVVTNLARLKQKYGDGVAAVKAAVAALAAADARRGLKTVLVDLSSAADAARYKFAAVHAAKVTDARANKRAVDRVFQATLPSYLLLLGATDVIPHQDLTNPLYQPGVDDDPLAWGDLPYACDADYGKEISRFLAPGRVVGRLPDLTHGADPRYLTRLLKTAAGYTDRPAADYAAFLGITAHEWKASTDQSLRAAFGTAAGMKTSPPSGPPWTAAELARRAHFVNCHGAPADPRFYGQKGNQFPIAHDATLLAGKLSEGTVAAAECCYGAELYDPAAAGGRMGMPNAYLAGGAYAFFGSSTIAYGPAVGNGSADLVCQYFLRHVRAGASVGRACLQARVDFVGQAVTLTPTDLKTLAQFSLMGDPAVTPVRAAGAAPHLTPHGARKPAAAAAAVAKLGRMSRRATLEEMAAGVAAAVMVAAQRIDTPTPAKAKRLLTLAADAGLTAPSVLSFAVGGPPAAPGAVAAAALPKAFAAAGAAVPGIVHAVFERVKTDPEVKAIRIRGIEVVEYGASLETRPFVSR